MGKAGIPGGKCNTPTEPVGNRREIELGVPIVAAKKELQMWAHYDAGSLLTVPLRASIASGSVVDVCV